MRRIIGVAVVAAVFLSGVRSPALGAPRFPMQDAAPERFERDPSHYRVSNGIVEHRYHGRWVFNPVSTSRYCTAAYNNDRPDIVEKVARALLARQEASGAWRYGYANVGYRVAPGWISAMAQGLGMGCLLAAFAHTGDEEFSEAAYRAFRVIVTRYGDDGTRASMGAGAMWFEEVAAHDLRPAHILNGFIFVLGAIWFSNQIDPHAAYQRALNEGTAALKANVDRFVIGRGRSWYDLTGENEAGRDGYNATHVRQLRWMAQLTGYAHFLDVARLLGS